MHAQTRYCMAISHLENMQINPAYKMKIKARPPKQATGVTVSKAILVASFYNTSYEWCLLCSKYFLFKRKKKEY